MKQVKIPILTAAMLMMLLTSCLNKSAVTYETSDVCTVASFYFGANDSIAGLGDAVFTICNDSVPGLIVNLDSLPYGTRIDSCYPHATFDKTVAAAILYLSDSDSIYLTGADTVDFSQPLRLRVISSDMAHYKDYEIRVLVHQVEPDLYTWSQLSQQAYEGEGSMQRAVWFDGTMWWYVNSGVKSSVYVSADGSMWTDRTEELSGLPAYCDFADMQMFGGKLIFTDGAYVYVSADGLQWERTEASSVLGGGLNFGSLLFELNDSLRAIVVDGVSLRLASSADAARWVVGGALPAGFPHEDFAALTFPSPTGQMQALVVGGRSVDGEALDSRWLTTDAHTWLNASSDRQPFARRVGATIVYYGQKLMMFGGFDADSNVADEQLLESSDAGLTWSVPDTLSNRLPDGFARRGNASAVLAPDSQTIYLLGGHNRTETYRDVWRIRLNSIGW